MQNVLKSGIIRGKQRYLCKSCNYNFTLGIKSKKEKNNSTDVDKITTIVDIAKAIGLSASTVSRALHNSSGINIHTKEQIQKIATEFDYQPNMIAQNLVNRKSQSIGVIIPDLETTFFSSMLSGITQVAYNIGYKVIICISNESKETEIQNVQALMNNMIDGLLICYTNQTKSFEHVKQYLRKGIPVVEFYRVSDVLDVPKIINNNKEGVQSILDHLIQMKRKRISIILANTNMLINKERLEGYESALHKKGIKWNQIAYSDMTYNSIKLIIDKFLLLKKIPDAILVSSDKCAVYAIQYLKVLGVQVPKDICIAGIGGNEMICDVITPKLTSYDMKTKQIGITAAECLFDKISHFNKFDVDKISIGGELIIRESTNVI
jgi:LacI family transcriptional regulator